MNLKANRQWLHQFLQKYGKIPATISKQVGRSAIIYFFTLAAANEIVRTKVDLSTWIKFKIFGTMLITIIFVWSQFIRLKNICINYTNVGANLFFDYTESSIVQITFTFFNYR